ncbi:MAG: branched-chain amino acid ABC transporter permease [Candidatus Heimdallarchaeota archaeon]
MKRPGFLDEKSKVIIYFVIIELVVAFLGILLAAITILTETSREFQGITPPMNIILIFLDLFGGISLGTILELLQSLLIQEPTLFLLTASIVVMLFSIINLLVVWFLWNLKPQMYPTVLCLATFNLSFGLLGMPRGSLHLPIGIVGLAVNIAMIRLFMPSSTPVHRIRIATISHLVTGVTLLFIGLHILLIGHEGRPLVQIGVFLGGILAGSASIVTAFGLWAFRNGAYVKTVTLAMINISFGMLQWADGALVVASSLFTLYYLLQTAVQEEFQMSQKMGILMLEVLETICGFSSVLVGLSSAIAGYMGDSGASIIGGTLAILMGLVLLRIAWETQKYGVRSPRLARLIILVTFTVNLIAFGLDSSYQTPVGIFERRFGVIVLIACMALLGLATKFEFGSLLELNKERATWFSLFASIAILLRLVWILSPDADVVSFSVDSAIYMGIFGILALSLNIEAGTTGLMNFGKVAFFAIGAYTTAILSRPKDPTPGLNPGLAFPFIICLILSILLAAFFGFLISIPTLRLRADYLAIVTITFGEILRFVLRDPKLRPTLGSTFGLNVSRPFESFFDWCIEHLAAGLSDLGTLYYRILFYFPLIYLCLLICYLFSQRILNSPFGRVLRSVREDEVAAEALGKDIYQFKTKAFIIGSGMGGLAGSLFAGYVTFVAESNFLPLVTFSIWIMMVIGGTGNNRGVIFGAILVQYFRRFTRFKLPNYALFGFSAENFRFIVIGLLLVIFIMYRREGIFKEEPIQTVATEIGLALERKKAEQS